jgi:hypothetical protein
MVMLVKFSQEQGDWRCLLNTSDGGTATAVMFVASDQNAMELLHSLSFQLHGDHVTAITRSLGCLVIQWPTSHTLITGILLILDL